MQSFLVVATAHFLALLSPGPDFLLIARTSLSQGWRAATGTCLGVTLANGVFIVACFVGTATMDRDGRLFVALQWGGAGYLSFVGAMALRHAGKAALPTMAPERTGSVPPGMWWRQVGMGLLSGLLNPKNALFYASLAAALAGTPAGSPGWKAVYGAWMVSIVLLWDLLVAAAIGNRAVAGRFGRALPWLERAAGVMLLVVAVVIGTTAANARPLKQHHRQQDHAQIRTGKQHPGHRHARGQAFLRTAEHDGDGVGTIEGDTDHAVRMSPGKSMIGQRPAYPCLDLGATCFHHWPS